MIDNDFDETAEIVGLVAFVIWSAACIGFGVLLGLCMVKGVS